MANVNKVTLIGRLTRDPEVRTFNNGGKVATLGFAVSNRKKTSSGDWEDEPMFIDLKLFSRGENTKMVDMVADGTSKGTPLYIEGHLVLEQWNDQQGNRRSKHVVIIDNLQFLEPRQSGSSNTSRGSRPRQDQGGYSDGGFDDSPPDENIPF